MEFNLEAKTIYFRLVKEQDAGFICSLRNDDKLNNYISKSTADEDAQREWILNYKESVSINFCVAILVARLASWTRRISRSGFFIFV